MSQRVMILGKRFAALRRERYLTQDEFAQRLEMSPANVRRLEQSEVGGMQVKNFRRLATLFNVSPDDLRRRIGASSEPAEAGLHASVVDGPSMIDSTFPASLKPDSKKYAGGNCAFPWCVGSQNRARSDATGAARWFRLARTPVCGDRGRRLHGA